MAVLIKHISVYFLMSTAVMLLFSCSLNYTTEVSTESVVPEFSFTNMVLRRYTDDSIEMEITADSMEQYKNNGGNYILNAKFKTWDKDSVLQTWGKCSLLGVDSIKETYTLFNDIVINNYENDIEIHASALKYDGKTESLTSGEDDNVYIKRKGVEIEGSGFSANGIDQSFSFAKLKSGQIETESDTSK